MHTRGRTRVGNAWLGMRAGAHSVTVSHGDGEEASFITHVDACAGARSVPVSAGAGENHKQTQKTQRITQTQMARARRNTNHRGWLVWCTAAVAPAHRGSGPTALQHSGKPHTMPAGHISENRLVLHPPRRQTAGDKRAHRCNVSRLTHSRTLTRGTP